MREDRVQRIKRQRVADPIWTQRKKQESRMNVAYHQVKVQEKKERYKRVRTDLQEQENVKRARLEYERWKQRIIPRMPSPEKCQLFSPCRRLRRRKRQAEICRTPDSFVSRISNQSRRSRSPRYSPY